MKELKLEMIAEKTMWRKLKIRNKMEKKYF
jgi:hypothetical protein